MFKIISWIFGSGSSILFTIIGILTLVFEKKFGIETVYLMVTFWSFMCIAYIYLQAIQVFLLKGKNELKGIKDLGMSIIPLIPLNWAVAKKIYFFHGEDIQVWLILYIMYLITWFFDFVFLGVMVIRIFRMTSEVSQN